MQGTIRPWQRRRNLARATLGSQLNEDARAIDADGVAGRILGRGHAADLSVANIELGPVPWAHDAKAVEFSVTERPAIVGT